MADRQPDHIRPTVPKEYAGRWIAWDAGATRIIASAEDLRSVAELARQAGESRPSFEKVPRADRRLIGAVP